MVNIFDLTELLLVFCISLVLLLPDFIITKKPVKERLKKALCDFAEKFFLSGSFITVILLLIFISNPESEKTVESERLKIPFYFLLLKEFRPFLYGVLAKIIRSVFYTQHTNEATLQQNINVEQNGKKAEQLLSRREKEVAVLVMRGLSNAEIADELFISVATVKRHLATIFEKLEISSRKEIAEKLK